MTTRRKGRDAIGALEAAGAKYTLGAFMESIRLGEEWSLSEMGAKIGLSRTYVSDIEHGRRSVSPQKAAAIARKLGYHEGQMVELALQAIVDHSKLKYRVHVQKAA